MGNIIDGGANDGLFKYLYISILLDVKTADKIPIPKLIKILINNLFILSPI